MRNLQALRPIHCIVNAIDLQDSMLDRILGRMLATLSDVTSKSLTCTGKSSRLFSWLDYRWVSLRMFSMYSEIRPLRGLLETVLEVYIRRSR